MPALPELRDGEGAVGGVEVHRQPQAQEPGAARRHVAVAGEIEVELQGIAQNHRPGGGGAEVFDISPAVGDHYPQGVRQQHLLAEAAPQGVEPGGAVPVVGAEEALPRELGEKAVRLQNRAGGEAGEEKAVEKVVRQAPDRGGLAGPALLQIPELLKGEKAQPQGHEGDAHRPAREKAQVLEAQQHQDVIARRRPEDGLATLGAGDRPGPREKADGGAHGQHGHPPPAGLPAEVEAAQQQRRPAQGGPYPAQGMAEEDGQRQKAQKGQGLKRHLIAP